MDLKEISKIVLDAFRSALSAVLTNVFTKIIISSLACGSVVAYLDGKIGTQTTCEMCSPSENKQTQVFVLPRQMKLDLPIAQHKHSYYLVYKDNAILQGDKKGEGIYLDDFQSSWLEKFHGALKACSAHAPVKVKIFGFASSAEFMKNGVISPDSDKMNRIVANLRAKEVASWIPEDKNLFVSVKEWGSYEDMEKSRPYIDKFINEDITDQQMLNRSVSIEISDLGGCMKPEFSVSSIE